MGRPVKEKTLTPKDIVEAAIACLEAEGESALGVNRVARSLGIQPPSIYKHLNGNAALRRAVALEIWQRFIALCKQRTEGMENPRALIYAIGHAIREFARVHPILHTVMTQTKFESTDPDFDRIVQEMLAFYTMALKSYGFDQDDLIDVIRMLHAAFYGFIQAEKADIFTLPRSLDTSYERMLNTLINTLEIQLAQL
ncbi:TetR/AcrR family transcriptional regulator [Scytonema sp. NUACC21]